MDTPSAASRPAVGSGVKVKPTTERNNVTPGGQGDKPSNVASGLLRVIYVSELPEHSKYSTTVDFDASDVHLIVGDTLFKTHNRKLSKFTVFREHIANKGEKRPCLKPTLEIQCPQYTATDFNNMFRILYASVIEGAFEFDTPILISALRIASAYDCPTLRAFCFHRLDTIGISPIKLLQLGRECNFSFWEKQAYIELCVREKEISREEALVLGMDAFVAIVQYRENNLRGKDPELPSITL